MLNIYSSGFFIWESSIGKLESRLLCSFKIILFIAPPTLLKVKIYLSVSTSVSLPSGTGFGGNWVRTTTSSDTCVGGGGVVAGRGEKYWNATIIKIDNA